MPKKNKMILMLLSLSMFVVVLDSAIINVALPAIKKALNFKDANLQWVLTSYILTFGGFLMLGGRTADLYGRRLILVIGIAGFSVFSLLIGFSFTSEMLIVLRGFQGLSGALMAPAALSILLTTFPEGEERNKALSIWSIVASGGAAAGVFLGGFLTQFLGWQWCFFVNVPIGILAAFGILKFIPAHIKEAEDRKLDIPGAVLITLGLIALVYGLTLASQAGWTAKETIITFVFSGVLHVGFLINEIKVKHPLVHLSIFKIRNVTGGNLIMLPLVSGGLGMFFFLSLYIQNILHYSPVKSGLCFLPLPIIIGVISYNAPVLLHKLGFKLLAIIGLALTTGGVFWVSFLGLNSSYWINILPAFIILAFGFGISFVSITVASTTGVPDDKSGLASGLINTSQQVGGALGLAVLAVVSNSVLAEKLLLGFSISEASVKGYQLAFLTAAAMIFVAFLAAVFVIHNPNSEKE